jgi:hypothetical protein
MSDEQPNAYDVVIADLETERERLTVTIDALKRIKNLGVPFAASAAFVTRQPNASVTTSIPHDAFYGMTIPDAARKYLSWGGNRNTKSNPELCEALLEGGFQTKAENFGESVRATLTRHPDFAKINGQWGLKEWYPTARSASGVRKVKRGTSDQGESQVSADDTNQAGEIEPIT